MKYYKFSRKEIAKMACGRDYLWGDLGEDLLATISKEEYSQKLMMEQVPKDKCKHKLSNIETHDQDGTFHINGDTCSKCGKHILDWDEGCEKVYKKLIGGMEEPPIEEIKMSKYELVSTLGVVISCLENLSKKVNSLNKK